MNTRNGFLLSSALATLLLAIGCSEVEDRLSWSPDGTRAILRVGDGICLMDTNGNLSSPLINNVEAAAWLPDGRGLVMVRQLTVGTWAEAARLLPPKETATAQSLAKGLPDLLKAALASADGDPAAIEKRFVKPLKMELSEYVPAAILCLLNTNPAALRQLPAKLQTDLSNLSTTKVAEVSVLLLTGNQATGSPRVIERTLTGLKQPRPSPSANAVAFLRDSTLIVAPLDGGTNRVRVAEKIEGSYDWTPDGKSLVYAVRITEQESSGINLARIEQRTVVDATGALVEMGPQPIALNGSMSEPRVRCLPGGRVQFAGVSWQLPASDIASLAARFYLIDSTLGTNAVPVTIPTAPGALPQDLAAFAPSPDGRQVAIVESGSDSVAVLDVATGALEIVSPKRGWKSRMLPAWRSADELYFAALPEASSTRPELIRWRKGIAPQVLSRGWTDAAVAGLLEKPSK